MRTHWHSRKHNDDRAVRQTAAPVASSNRAGMQISEQALDVSREKPKQRSLDRFDDDDDHGPDFNVIDHYRFGK